MTPRSQLVCAGCGAEAPPGDPYPFRCRNADGDDIDHVLRRRLDTTGLAFPDGTEAGPFLRYRTLLHAWHVARDAGVSDAELCELVRRLDARVAEVDGHGFAVTPFTRADALSGALGFSAEGGVWVKDETGNVAGSHKARHLFGVLVWLSVMELLGRVRTPRPELAIASCGNAALAAAVVAAAGRRSLRVFVPVDADPVVLERLEGLGALVETCPRVPGETGDPTVKRLREALAAGALPFTCQGDLNGLAVEGGHTLGWELAATGVPLDRVVVQVGGGALASGVAAGLAEAVALGALTRLPRIDTVQTASAWPLKRAYDAIRDYDVDLAYARRHRATFMWPWETEPSSVAHGILDDETYDWAVVVEAMLKTGGTPVVASEERLAAANDAARERTDIPVDPTGSAGLAGLLELRERGEVDDDERVAVLFTGVDRTSTTDTKGSSDEELSGTRHPVAQGL